MTHQYTTLSNQTTSSSESHQIEINELQNTQLTQITQINQSKQINQMNQNKQNNSNETNETQIDISTSSSDDTSTSTTLNTLNTSHSTTNRYQSFSTIFLPQPNKDEVDGYIDIDGYVTPYDVSQNIFVQLFLLTFPCFSKPFCSHYKCEKCLRAMFSISFLFSCILIVVFACEVAHCGITSFAKNPGMGPSSEGLMNFGARYSYAIKIDLEFYRIFSCLFLSPNICVLFIEILLFMRYLIYFERRWGILLFLITFFMTGEAGVLISTFVDQNNISVCATCPISGMIAVYIIEILLTKKLDAMEAKRSIYLALVVVFVLSVLQISPLLDLSAMIGSGVVGFGLGMLYFLGENKWFCQQNVIFQTCMYGAVCVFLLGYLLVCCLGIFMSPPVKIH